MRTALDPVEPTRADPISGSQFTPIHALRKRRRTAPARRRTSFVFVASAPENRWKRNVATSSFGGAGEMRENAALLQSNLARRAVFIVDAQARRATFTHQPEAQHV